MRDEADLTLREARARYFAANGLPADGIYDTFGNTTVLHFSRLQRNPQLSPALFKFVPPKGADVLGEE